MLGISQSPPKTSRGKESSFFVFHRASGTSSRLSILKMPFMLLLRKTFLDCLASCSGTSVLNSCIDLSITGQWQSGHLQDIDSKFPVDSQMNRCQSSLGSTVENLNNYHSSPRAALHLQVTCRLTSKRHRIRCYSALLTVKQRGESVYVQYRAMLALNMPGLQRLRNPRAQGADTSLNLQGCLGHSNNDHDRNCRILINQYLADSKNQMPP